MTQPMTKESAIQFFACLFSGEHHIPPHGGPDGVKPFGEGWCVNTWENLATFDGDLLTELVFLAHDKAVRVEIQQGGPRRIKIIIHQRQRAPYPSESLARNGRQIVLFLYCLLLMYKRPNEGVRRWNCLFGGGYDDYHEVLQQPSAPEAICRAALLAVSGEGDLENPLP